MSLSKLKKIHVIIIGAFLCVAAAVALFMLMIKPANAAYASAKARYDTAEPLGNAQAQAAAQRERADAIVKVALAQKSLSEQMHRRMPDLNFSRRDIGMFALWNEQINVLGPLLESFANDKKVNVLSASFTIPAPPANPNSSVFDQDVLVFPLGQVQVQGNFKALMDNIRRWNNCRRLVMVSQVPQLAGMSPQLTMQYGLTCYIFPVATGGPKIPLAGTGGTQGGR